MCLVGFAHYVTWVVIIQNCGRRCCILPPSRVRNYHLTQYQVLTVFLTYTLTFGNWVC